MKKDLKSGDEPFGFHFYFRVKKLFKKIKYCSKSKFQSLSLQPIVNSFDILNFDYWTFHSKWLWYYSDKKFSFHIFLSVLLVRLF